MANQAQPIAPYDAEGRAVGIFGVLEILAENANWIRNQVSEVVGKWSPNLVEETANALHRCLKEVPEQVSDDHLRRIANSYPRAVEHAGVYAPTFIELVCQSLGARFCFICERRTSKRDIEQILTALAKANFDELAAEVSRELRISSESILAESVVKPAKIVTAEIYSYMVPEDHQRASSDLATFHREVGSALHIVRAIQNYISAGIVPSDNDIKCAIGYGRLLDVDRKVILKFAALYDKPVSFAGRTFDAFHHAATVLVGEEFQKFELFGQGCGGPPQYLSFAELVPNAKKQYQVCIDVGTPMVGFDFDVDALRTRCEVEFDQLTERLQVNTLQGADNLGARTKRYSNCPCHNAATNNAECLKREILKRIGANLGPVPPSGEHEKALTHFLKAFNNSPHCCTVWEQFDKLRFPTPEDFARWQAEAARSGLNYGDFLAKAVLPHLKQFLARAGIPLPVDPPQIATSLSFKRFAERQNVVLPKDWNAKRPTEPSVIVRDTIALAWTLHNLQAALTESPQAPCSDGTFVLDDRCVGAMFAIFAQRRWWLDEFMWSRASDLRIQLRKLHEFQIQWNGQIHPSFTEAAWDVARDTFSTVMGFVINLPGGQSYNWRPPFAAEDFDPQGKFVQSAFLSGLLRWPTDYIDFRSLAAGIEVEWAKLMPTGSVNASPDAPSEGAKKKTQRSQEAAYQSYELAAQNLSQPTDQEAYEWLKENGPPAYDLPTFETWGRYVRDGRRAHGTQKNSPRHGRSGRSIARLESLDDSSTGDEE